MNGTVGIRRLVAGAAVLAAASALLWYGYHFVLEVPMFPWTDRSVITDTAAEPRALPAIDLAAPATVETATFAVG